MIENISTIVIACSALVTASATIVLAIITWHYVRLTNEILKATNNPEVGENTAERHLRDVQARKGTTYHANIF